MRIAYFTPLSPVPSGISSYSEELLPYLAHHADIDIYIDDYEPTSPLIVNNFRIRNHHDFGRRKSRYDVTIYQMGNHAPFHESMYRVMVEHPGIVVLHDYVCAHFYRAITLGRGDVDGFREIMRYCYGAAGLDEAAAAEIGPTDIFRYALNKKILDCSLGTIVHSHYVKNLIEQDAPAARVHRIPMGVEVTEAAGEGDRARIRARYGLSESDFIVASFGRVTDHKRMDVSLQAFARLAAARPDAKYLLVGEVTSQHALSALVRKLAIEDRVTVTGHVSDVAFQEYLALSDVCLSLRYPTAGETSLSVLKAMEAGRPVAVSNYAQFGELPDHCVLKVDLGEREVDLLSAYLQELATDEVFRREIGENARRFVHEHHNLEDAARAYVDFAGNCVERPAADGYGLKIASSAAGDLESLGGPGHRGEIRAQTTDLLQELGVLPGRRSPHAPSPARLDMQRIRYYGKRLQMHSRSAGRRATAALAADKLLAQVKPGRSPQAEPPGRLRRLKCAEIFEEACVLADGRAVCSCYDSMAQNVLGHVGQERMYDIFNGLGYQQLRHAMMTSKTPGLCRTCALRNKRLRHTDGLVMRRIKALQVEIIHACNLRCPECSLTFAPRPNESHRMMKYSTFTDIIDQLAGSLEIVKFYNYGESFLHRDCMKMLAYIKSVDPRISVLISTNGTRIGPAEQKGLVDLGIDVLSFSIDGVSQGSYGRYRVGGDLEMVLANLGGLVAHRERAGARKPQVLWQYILFEWNDSDAEILEAKQRAVAMGVDTLLWILTHTRGASRRFLAGSASLAELTSRNGFQGSRTQFICSSSAAREPNAFAERG